MAALLLWVFLGSPWLRVKSVNVVGGSAEQQASVQQVTDRVVGQPLVNIDTAGVQRDLSGIPAFSRVDVIRDLSLIHI